MFTGIVAAVGRIQTVNDACSGVRITVDTGELDLRDVKVGDSIAVDGVCLTVVELGQTQLQFDVSPETLNCTIGYTAGARVNLEKSLRLSDRLDGHLVSAHVDGVGRVIRSAALGANRVIAIESPSDLAKFIARKGAITVNGVSLTVNSISGSTFEINVIPHTLQATNLGHLDLNAKVNLEIDMFARYCERLLTYKIPSVE